ncbi:unnamed protein product [Schistocephalus solidus]|uniref:Nuclear pore complex protein Nup214 n=1 Tax=Schistocephalus solidus TaxID=70667 RepID=A0A183SMH2_SCHSO|nr:unnamed protein product [Schistocephalus solidus]
MIFFFLEDRDLVVFRAADYVGASAISNLRKDKPLDTLRPNIAIPFSWQITWLAVNSNGSLLSVCSSSTDGLTFIQLLEISKMLPTENFGFLGEPLNLSAPEAGAEANSPSAAPSAIIDLAWSPVDSNRLAIVTQSGSLRMFVCSGQDARRPLTLTTAILQLDPELRQKRVIPLSPILQSFTQFPQSRPIDMLWSSSYCFLVAIEGPTPQQGTTVAFISALPKTEPRGALVESLTGACDSTAVQPFQYHMRLWPNSGSLVAATWSSGGETCILLDVPALTSTGGGPQPDSLPKLLTEMVLPSTRAPIALAMSVVLPKTEPRGALVESLTGACDSTAVQPFQYHMRLWPNSGSLVAATWSSGGETCILLDVPALTSTGGGPPPDSLPKLLTEMVLPSTRAPIALAMSVVLKDAEVLPLLVTRLGNGIVCAYEMLQGPNADPTAFAGFRTWLQSAAPAPNLPPPAQPASSSAQPTTPLLPTSLSSATNETPTPTATTATGLFAGAVFGQQSIPSSLSQTATPAAITSTGLFGGAVFGQQSIPTTPTGGLFGGTAFGQQSVPSTSSGTPTAIFGGTVFGQQSVQTISTFATTTASAHFGGTVFGQPPVPSSQPTLPTASSTSNAVPAAHPPSPAKAPSQSTPAPPPTVATPSIIGSSSSGGLFGSPATLPNQPTGGPGFGATSFGRPPTPQHKSELSVSVANVSVGAATTQSTEPTSAQSPTSPRGDVPLPLSSPFSKPQELKSPATAFTTPQPLKQETPEQTEDLGRPPSPAPIPHSVLEASDQFSLALHAQATDTARAWQHLTEVFSGTSAHLAALASVSGLLPEGCCKGVRDIEKSLNNMSNYLDVVNEIAPYLGSKVEYGVLVSFSSVGSQLGSPLFRRYAIDLLALLFLVRVNLQISTRVNVLCPLMPEVVECHQGPLVLHLPPLSILIPHPSAVSKRLFDDFRSPLYSSSQITRQLEKATTLSLAEQKSLADFVERLHVDFEAYTDNLAPKFTAGLDPESAAILASLKKKSRSAETFLAELEDQLESLSTQVEEAAAENPLECVRRTLAVNARLIAAERARIEMISRFSGISLSSSQIAAASPFRKTGARHVLDGDHDGDGAGRGGSSNHLAKSASTPVRRAADGMRTPAKSLFLGGSVVSLEREQRDAALYRLLVKAASPPLPIHQVCQTAGHLFESSRLATIKAAEEDEKVVVVVNDKKTSAPSQRSPRVQPSPAGAFYSPCGQVAFSLGGPGLTTLLLIPCSFTEQDSRSADFASARQGGFRSACNLANWRKSTTGSGTINRLCSDPEVTAQIRDLLVLRLSRAPGTWTRFCLHSGFTPRLRYGLIDSFFLALRRSRLDPRNANNQYASMVPARTSTTAKKTDKPKTKPGSESTASPAASMRAPPSSESPKVTLLPTSLVSPPVVTTLSPTVKVFGAPKNLVFETSQPTITQPPAVPQIVVSPSTVGAPTSTAPTALTVAMTTVATPTTTGLLLKPSTTTVVAAAASATTTSKTSSAALNASLITSPGVATTSVSAALPVTAATTPGGLFGQPAVRFAPTSQPSTSSPVSFSVGLFGQASASKSPTAGVSPPTAAVSSSAPAATNVSSVSSSASSLFSQPKFSAAGVSPASTALPVTTISFGPVSAAATTAEFGGLFNTKPTTTPTTATTTAAGPVSASATGLFATAAATTTKPAEGGLFGQPAAGLFGSGAMTPPVIFGRPASGDGSLFGQKAGTNSTAATTSSTTAAPAVSFFTNPATSSGAAGGGGLFGVKTAPTAGGLFGTPKSTATGGVFGGPTPSTTTSQLFGQSAAPATVSAFSGLGLTSTASNSSVAGSPFGQAMTKPAAGGLFGAVTGSTPTSPPGGSGLFGQTAVSPAGGGGGLFGQTAATTTAPATGLFGSPLSASPSGGLFGTQSQAVQPGAAAVNNLFAMSNFGLASSSTTSSSSAGGGGLFGKPTTSTTSVPGSTGLFGSPAGTTAPGGGGGLFGAAAPKPASQTGLFAAPTLGKTVFGSSTGTAISGGGVGGGGGLFGTASNAAAAPGGGGLFGSPTPAAAPSSGGLFSSAAPASGGLFGAAASGFGAPPAFGSVNAGQSNPLTFPIPSSPSTGVGGFGSPPLFGQSSPFGAVAAASPPAGGLFASLANNAGGSTFGSLAHATSAPPAPQNLFGEFIFPFWTRARVLVFLKLQFSSVLLRLR